MLFATVLLKVTHRLVSGSWRPIAVTKQVVLLGVSGLLGLTIGDQALITALLDIGPRLSTLIMTTAPFPSQRVLSLSFSRLAEKPPQSVHEF